MGEKKNVAIVLAGGKGKRMNCQTSKQYLLLKGKPILYYSLKAFQESNIDEIVLVVARGEEEYCRKDIVERYGLTKVNCIVEGGRERYHSVYQGLLSVNDADYVLVHDGARPFITDEIITRTMESVAKHQACVVGMPVKDTIKIADTTGYVENTPDRNLVWMVQTPQAFTYPLIREAYDKIISENIQTITDDAMALELMLNQKVFLVEGSYENIKITTPEDIVVAEALLKFRDK